MKRDSALPRLFAAAALTAALVSPGAWAAADASELFAHCADGPPSRDLQGRDIPADFWRGGPVLAVFWSPDCGFCQRHNARLMRLHREQPSAAVLGVAVDGSTDAVRQAVGRRGYDFPVIRDGLDRCALRPQLTERRLVPMTCWLGAAPAGPRCIPGEMSEDDLRTLLRQAARP